MLDTVADMLTTVGDELKRVLLDGSITQELIKNKTLLELCAAHHTLHRYVIAFIAECNHADEVVKLHTEGKDTLEVFLQKVQSLKLPTSEEDERVPVIIQKLNDVLADYDVQFKGKEVIGILWGSFYFGFPSTDPDIDFDFIVSDNSAQDPQLSQISFELDTEMGIKMHTNIINLRIMKQMLKDVENDNWATVNKYFIQTVSILLTGQIIPLSGAKTSDVVSKMQDLKNTILKLAENNVILRLLLIDAYLDVLYWATAKDRPALKK